VAAPQKLAARTSFFKKAGEESFFAAKETSTFFKKTIQPKLTVSTPDEPQEKEADAVAETVMRTPEPVAPLSPLADKKEEKLQRKDEEVLQAKAETPLTPAILCKAEAKEKLQEKEVEQAHTKEVLVHHEKESGGKIQPKQDMGVLGPKEKSIGVKMNGDTETDGSNDLGDLNHNSDLSGAGQGKGVPAASGTGSCPSSIAFSTGNQPVHVPLCGITSVTANTTPANIPGIGWTLTAGSTAVAGGTAISSAGDITFGGGQTGGTLNVAANQSSATGGGTCFSSRPIALNSHPTGISSTFVIGAPANAAQNYGAVFDHNFTSADGSIASLASVPVGEEFVGVPNPTGTSHVITGTPLGNFTLATANLTNNATNNWFLQNGNLGGNRDTVTIGRGVINVGRFLTSASNPSPANTLPAGFTIVQGLHWFCSQAATGSRWTRFTTVNHVRTLRLNSSGTGVEFAVSVNGVENVDLYTGHPAIVNARATIAAIPSTPAKIGGKPAPTPSTTTITADSRPAPLPGGHALRFSIRGPAHGCTINPTTGVLTAGSQTGTVVVRVRDSAAANPNFDEVTINIVPPPPAPAPTGTPSPGSAPTSANPSP
jgi:hypothetical protein